MEKFTTEQLKNVILEMSKMPTTPDLALAWKLTCDELEIRMGEDSFFEWFDKV